MRTESCVFQPFLLIRSFSCPPHQPQAGQPVPKGLTVRAHAGNVRGQAGSLCRVLICEGARSCRGEVSSHSEMLRTRTKVLWGFLPALSLPFVFCGHIPPSPFPELRGRMGLSLCGEEQPEKWVGFWPFSISVISSDSPSWRPCHRWAGDRWVRGSLCKLVLMVPRGARDR